MVQGVSTRGVDQLVEALGLSGLSRSQVCRICAGLERQMVEFEPATLGGVPLPVAGRQGGQGAAGRAGGEHGRGHRRGGEGDGPAGGAGAAETCEFWLAFLRHLVGRGLRGVRLVISAAHQGLKRAIAEVLAGASWQRCRVRFMGNPLAWAPRGWSSWPERSGAAPCSC